MSSWKFLKISIQVVYPKNNFAKNPYSQILKYIFIKVLILYTILINKYFILEIFSKKKKNLISIKLLSFL